MASSGTSETTSKVLRPVKDSFFTLTFSELFKMSMLEVLQQNDVPDFWDINASTWPCRRMDTDSLRVRNEGQRIRPLPDFVYPPNGDFRSNVTASQNMGLINMSKNTMARHILGSVLMNSTVMSRSLYSPRLCNAILQSLDVPSDMQIEFLKALDGLENPLCSTVRGGNAILGNNNAKAINETVLQYMNEVLNYVESSSREMKTLYLQVPLLPAFKQALYTTWTRRWGLSCRILGTACDPFPVNSMVNMDDINSVINGSDINKYSLKAPLNSAYVNSVLSSFTTVGTTQTT
ncbi:hypothetical protein GUITHDRAFT_109184 [Guillardia theta CCMP2712]|uniref:Uncharacterized protein n=1 Tax=Guillardia theta (strain CCMP2712) TaxID=905079 RepID=L1J889_GUITC|nr:hypothetical protein GUITHDRAFT_109184 [Guillardia theta CCMP2712]EKX44758.1 hypothetical protein GUITHDRAFT_109184 [Guillardia theta CCMP2712]|eukprot:XP_005831738.1 hypothetical protein GUITHDRAFT_109184 [Guillardia theta CCMP2712]